MSYYRNNDMDQYKQTLNLLPLLHRFHQSKEP